MGRQVKCDVRAPRPRARFAAWWRAVAVVAGAACATACAGLLGIDDRQPDPQDAGGDDATASDAYRPEGGGADVGVVRGPVMVSVGSFYIDSTEVTVADYKKFLAAKGSDTGGQPSECSWNTAYWDSTNAMNPDTWPITNVDWCDARAFCAWAGKRLCGKIGGGSVTAEAHLFTAPPTNEWYLACGGPAGGTHPNANPTCNSNDGFGNLAPVGSYPGCEGFYPGLFDMEGNAAEWIDGCGTSEGGAVCFLLGGAIFDQQSYCDEVYDYSPDTLAVSFGFRCCGG
jgi:formylglycine-generating enzyme required for sulfatase activity